jgi:hypothetical protein
MIEETFPVFFIFLTSSISHPAAFATSSAEISGEREALPPVFVSKRMTRCPLSWINPFKKAASAPFVSKVETRTIVFCINFFPPESPLSPFLPAVGRY